jgi:RNA polymerase sigma-70 factor (ECF subfamily)
VTPTELFDKEISPLMPSLKLNAMRLCLNDEWAADDLVQETMTKAFRFLHQYEPGTNAAGWLNRIMGNAHIDNHRKVIARPQEVLADQASDAESGPLGEAEAGPSAEDLAIEGSIHHALLDALDALPVEMREAIYLSDVKGLSNKQVSEKMGIPHGTAQSRIYRGRKLLRASLADFDLELI